MRRRRGALGACVCTRVWLACLLPTPNPHPPTHSVSLDETHSLADVDCLLTVLAGSKAPGFTAESLAPTVATGVGAFQRASSFLQHPVFNSYHTGE